jgi:hypothetical protein
MHFVSKVSDLCHNISSNLSPDLILQHPVHAGPTLTPLYIFDVSVEEVLKILSSVDNKTSPIYYLPTR